MKKKQSYILLIIIVAITGWFGYNYFKNKKNAGSSEQNLIASSFLPNSCWIYHEYVFRVDFSDNAVRPLFFIQNTDGTFSPSDIDSSGNHIMGNGFIGDATGACVITEKMNAPWKKNDSELQPLKEMVDQWLESQVDLVNKEYKISGQTVALFVVLNKPADFIEYTASAPVPGQEEYCLIYPLKKIQMKGITEGISFLNKTTSTGSSIYQVLKTTFDEKDGENPVTKTSIDSIMATKNEDGYFENIKVINGDAFFQEGSMVFNQAGKCLGNLHYLNEKWKLIPIQSFIQVPPIYPATEPQEVWAYDFKFGTWGKG